MTLIDVRSVCYCSMRRCAWYEPTTADRSRLSSRHAASKPRPGPGSAGARLAGFTGAPSSHILPAASSRFRLLLPQLPPTSTSSRRTPRPYRNNIYRYFGRCVQTPCNGNVPLSISSGSACVVRTRACPLPERSGNFLTSQLCRGPSDVKERGKGPRGDEDYGDREAGSARWPSVDVGRRSAVTRDAGLQLQSHAWTRNNNGDFHSRKRRRGWPSKVLPVGVVL